MKRRIITMVLSIVLLSLIFIYFKEENYKVSYGLNNNPIAVMIYDEAQHEYVKKSSVPVGNYKLNEEKTYCTYGGEITYYNRTTGMVKYNLDIGDKCYVYFDIDTLPAYAIYSETDNSLIFYKNNDTVGESYNGRKVTAKYDGIENDTYVITTSPATNVPWYEYASAIKTVSVVDEIMPVSLNFWFNKLVNAESINLEKLNTKYADGMRATFNHAGKENQNFTLNLGSEFDTSNVTNMKAMFQSMGYSNQNFTLDLGDKFDTSNVIDMAYIFNYTGYVSNIFELNLGSKFDTSQVTNMSAAFANAGCSNADFTLNLGDKFDTSKVTNMDDMFNSVGKNSKYLILNLGDKFDTSNVLTMESMFSVTAFNAEYFVLDLGNKFDTSSVTNMSWMFYQCSKNSNSLKLNLGDKFNTSKVQNMYVMFDSCGMSDPNFELDLSQFVIQSSCNLSEFAQYSAKKIIFGEGWSNANLVSGMFLCNSSTPIEIVNAPANIQNYDFAADNRVPTFTTI